MKTPGLPYNTRNHVPGPSTHKSYKTENTNRMNIPSPAHAYISSLLVDVSNSLSFPFPFLPHLVFLEYNYIILGNYFRLIMIDSRLFYKFTCSASKVKGIIIFIFLINSL